MSPTAPIRFFVLLSFAAGVLSNSYIADQTRLYDHLFRSRGYNPKIVPNVDANTPVNVTVGMTLLGFDVDEEKNTFFINCWIQETWADSRLRWDPSKYGDIDKLNVPYYMVFRPDTSLYNSYGPQFMQPGTDEGNVVIDSNGVMLFFRHVGLKSGCAIDTTKKEQSCKLTFGSWVHNGLTLDYKLASEKLDVSWMVPHPKWEFAGYEVKREKKTYACCPEPYVDIALTMKFAEKISNSVNVAS